MTQPSLMTVPDADEPLYCGFCGKAQDQCFVLVAGPVAHICDECVQFCNDVIFDHRVRRAFERKPLASTEPPAA